ncbi:MAG: hypothetical protein JWN14_4480 [Chthonomonadales bacterium]|nr:hypothetical protein [Chthonomonadales bacterium]
MSTVLHRNLPILEVAEPHLLDELLLDRQLAGMVLSRLSDRVALIDPSQVSTLIARLRKIGHLPKAEA